MAGQAHNADEAFRRVSEAYQRLRSRNKGPNRILTKKVGSNPQLHSANPARCSLCFHHRRLVLQNPESGHTTYDLQPLLALRVSQGYTRTTLIQLYSGIL
jgi:hypothetical protein